MKKNKFYGWIFKREITQCKLDDSIVIEKIIMAMSDAASSLNLIDLEIYINELKFIMKGTDLGSGFLLVTNEQKKKLFAIAYKISISAHAVFLKNFTITPSTSDENEKLLASLNQKNLQILDIISMAGHELITSKLLSLYQEERYKKLKNEGNVAEIGSILLINYVNEQSKVNDRVVLFNVEVNLSLEEIHLKILNYLWRLYKANPDFKTGMNLCSELAYAYSLGYYDLSHNKSETLATIEQFLKAYFKMFILQFSFSSREDITIINNLNKMGEKSLTENSKEYENIRAFFMELLLDNEISTEKKLEIRYAMMHTYDALFTTSTRMIFNR